MFQVFCVGVDLGIDVDDVGCLMFEVETCLFVGIFQVRVTNTW